MLFDSSELVLMDFFIFFFLLSIQNNSRNKSSVYACCVGSHYPSGGAASLFKRIICRYSIIFPALAENPFACFFCCLQLLILVSVSD